MQEAFLHHYKNNLIFKNFCEFQGFTPSALKNYDDIKKIPFLIVTFFKREKSISVPDSEIELILSSSGTGGTKSATYLDGKSLARIKKILNNCFSSYKMVDYEKKVNYLMFTYDIKYAKEIGTAFSDEQLTNLTKINNCFYVLKFDKNKKSFYPDFEGAYRALKRFSKEKLPLRILGFPAFFYEFFELFGSKGKESFNFGNDSFIITGGGWKTHGEKEIERSEFKKNISEWLGIPYKNMRDLFGMVEHGIPYIECEEENFHIPIYSRIIARDPLTLEPLPSGSKGLLQFITPYINSFPAISILSTDFGIIHKVICRCQRNSPVFSFLGRAGLKKHKGCAITALELLSGQVVNS